MYGTLFMICSTHNILSTTLMYVNIQTNQKLTTLSESIMHVFVALFVINLLFIDIICLSEDFTMVHRGLFNEY